MFALQLACLVCNLHHSLRIHTLSDVAVQQEILTRFTLATQSQNTENDDCAHGRAQGIQGMVWIDLTTQRGWRRAVLNKAGTWAALAVPLCVCVWRWCNECRHWAGATLSPAKRCWHTNAKLHCDRRLRWVMHGTKDVHTQLGLNTLIAQ